MQRLIIEVDDTKTPEKFLDMITSLVLEATPQNLFIERVERPQESTTVLRVSTNDWTTQRLAARHISKVLRESGLSFEDLARLAGIVD